jgi:Ca2+/Na+ antiporter
MHAVIGPRYMIVWLSKSGCLLGISSTAMGLTFGAAGTSMPDCLVSLHVAKTGEGNMAVSNVFGSNIFDILFALGVPWVVATLVLGHSVDVDGSELLTAVMVGIFVFFAVHLKCTGFKLGPFIGRFYVCLYLAFFGYCFTL